MHADVIIFDPSEIRALATYTSPHLLAEGFDTVVVNGRIAFRNGHATGALRGRVLGAGPSQQADK